jgi:glycosyltransferase involved in cell wall biosynthesis
MPKVGWMPPLKKRSQGQDQPEVAAVIPAFRVESYVREVIRQIPGCVQLIIVVDDHSNDGTFDVLKDLAKKDSRLVLIQHKQNMGVGAAMKTGYLEALKRGAQIVVKVDGDGQAPNRIEELVAPIRANEAEYTKGNRFVSSSFVRRMPLTRKIGNLGLSFLVKVASGYWNLFDPTNGFTAISGRTLKALDFTRLRQRYLFECSILVELYLQGARVRQVGMPAIYNGAPSHLRISRALFEFPVYLVASSLRRFIHRYVLQDFTAVSVLVIAGTLLVTFGTVFGAYHWFRSLDTLVPATAGTVMLSGMPILMGTQLLLQAVVLDIGNVPK